VTGTSTAAARRHYGRLAAPDTTSAFTGTSVLCLPIGSCEQHGPHLPLNTDTVVAEAFTELLVERYGERHDLWALPVMPYGISPEHAWAPGTVTLRAATFLSLLDEVVREYTRATPARHFVIVNGHGGNRGILEAAVHELRLAHRVAVCVIHPSALSPVRTEGAGPEVHAGVRETSLMLALAPEDVHLDRLPADGFPGSHRPETTRRIVFDRGASWPWSSGDAAIAAHGVVGGDPRSASAHHGRSILAGALDAAADVLEQLATHRP
jgi:creatinine amidohydrolase